VPEQVQDIKLEELCCKLENEISLWVVVKSEFVKAKVFPALVLETNKDNPFEMRKTKSTSISGPIIKQLLVHNVNTLINEYTLQS